MIVGGGVIVASGRAAGKENRAGQDQKQRGYG